MTPQKLGRYEIVGELGKGAMGLVYLAKDPLIGRQLALKTFRLGFSAKDADREQFKARFLREAQSAGILSHPNIVTIHDVVVEDDGDFFIAMEYVKGTDLKVLMQKQGRLDVRFVLDVVAQIADGLDYAHSKGVIHRDIKPANIILTSDKQAKITDFGIARVEQSNLTVEGQLLGTPNYMAPEQIQGREVDHRADIFSLGVMLYEMVTGQKPFQGDNLTMVTHRIVYDAFTPPSQLVAGLPERLGQVLEKALEKDAGRRYSRGGEMARDLRAVFTAPGRSADGTASFLAPPEPPPQAAATGPSPTPAPTGRAPYPLNATTGGMASGTLSGQPSGSVVMASQEESGGLGKGLLIGAVVLLLGALAAVGLFVLRPGDEPPPAVAVDPQTEIENQYRPLVEQGQAALEAGDAMKALELFDRALVFLPGDKEIRRLREEAEQMIQDEEGLTPEEAQQRKLLRQAATALEAKNYPQAIELAESVLALDPENERAGELLAAAQEGLEVKSRVQNRFRNQPVVTDKPPGSTAERSRPAPAAQAQKATLEVDFFSEVSEGILRVFLGGEQIFSERFAFTKEETGLFTRTKKTSGGLSHQAEVPVGEHKLRVYVYRNGATESIEKDGTFAADQTRVLKVRVDKDGNVSVTLE